jgi:hypothetical protein
MFLITYGTGFSGTTMGEDKANLGRLYTNNMTLAIGPFTDNNLTLGINDVARLRILTTDWTEVVGSLNVTKNLTVSENLTVYKDLFVDGTANLDSASIATLDVTGTTTFTLAERLTHAGDPDTYIGFAGDSMQFEAGGVVFLTLSELAQDTFSINGPGADIDFKVKSANDDYALFINGSTDNVGIGSANPTHKLSVNGSMNVTGNLTLMQNLTVYGNISAPSAYLKTATISGNFLYLGENLVHGGDPDTFLQYTGDKVRFSVGGRDMLIMTESTLDTFLFDSDSANFTGNLTIMENLTVIGQSCMGAICIDSFAEINKSGAAAQTDIRDQAVNITSNVIFNNLTITGLLAMDAVVIASWDEINVTDTHVGANTSYLYNNSVLLSFNQTRLNETIDARDQDTFMAEQNITDLGVYYYAENNITDLGVYYYAASNITDLGIYYYTESNLTDLLDDKYLGIGSDWVNITGDAMTGALIGTNFTGTNFTVPTSGYVGGNTSCLILYSPDGTTTFEVCD